MKGRSALLGFTVRIHAQLLHKLTQALVDRAYDIGFKDAAEGRQRDSSKVRIDPFQIRKFQ